METLQRNFFDVNTDSSKCNRNRVILFLVLGVFSFVVGMSFCSLYAA